MRYWLTGFEFGMLGQEWGDLFRAGRELDNLGLVVPGDGSYLMLIDQMFCLRDNDNRLAPVFCLVLKLNCNDG